MPANRRQLFGTILGAALLVSGGCRERDQRASTAAGSPGPAASATISFEYGYQVHDFQEPRAYDVQVGSRAIANTRRGTLRATGKGFPDMSETVLARRTESARQRAFRDARANLEEALLGMTVSAPDVEGGELQLAAAMKREAPLRNRVDAVLRQPRVVRSAKKKWYWETELEIDLSKYELLLKRIKTFTRVVGPRGAEPPRPSLLQIGAAFPAFDLKDIASDRRYTLSGLSGKAILLFVWVPEDYHSVAALKPVEEFYQRMRGKGLQVVGIVPSKDSALAYKRILERKVSFLNLHDASGRTARMMGAAGLPLYVSLLGSAKIVTYYTVGSPIFHLQPQAPLYKVVAANIQGLRFPP